VGVEGMKLYRYILCKTQDPSVHECWVIVDCSDWSLATTGELHDTPGHLFISYAKALGRYTELESGEEMVGI
jgi:hypothetical protein